MKDLLLTLLHLAVMTAGDDGYHQEWLHDDRGDGDGCCSCRSSTTVRRCCQSTNVDARAIVASWVRTAFATAAGLSAPASSSLRRRWVAALPLLMSINSSASRRAPRALRFFAFSVVAADVAAAAGSRAVGRRWAWRCAGLVRQACGLPCVQPRLARGPARRALTRWCAARGGEAVWCAGRRCRRGGAACHAALPVRAAPDRRPAGRPPAAGPPAGVLMASPRTVSGRASAERGRGRSQRASCGGGRLTGCCRDSDRPHAPRPGPPAAAAHHRQSGDPDRLPADRALATHAAKCPAANSVRGCIDLDIAADITEE